MVSCMGLRRDDTRNNMSLMEVVSTMTTKDTQFLTETIYVETTFWS
jgi:hypothetical protein